MARTTNKLSATAVSKFNGRGRHGDGGGLWLNVTAGSNKTWVFRWTPRGGKPSEMGLGSYPAVSLAKARERAVLCRKQVADGLNPRIERDKLLGETFGQVADKFYEDMSGRWSNEKTRWQWQHTFNERCKKIRDRPMSQIQTSDIRTVLDPIWMKTPETAYRVRMRLEAVIDYATAHKIRGGENPARWKGHLSILMPARVKTVRHHPAMPYDELPNFISRLQNVEALSGRALEFLILTAGRTNEILKAEWREINFDDALWIVPKERMKARSEHVVPLSNRAMGILSSLYESRLARFIFPGQKPGKPLSQMSMEMLLRRMKIERATVHGFRSSFRDWCGDRTDYPREVAEAALAHKVGNDVEQAYRRSNALDKRRELMQAWSDFCASKC